MACPVLPRGQSRSFEWPAGAWCRTWGTLRFVHLAWKGRHVNGHRLTSPQLEVIYQHTIRKLLSGAPPPDLGLDTDLTAP